MSQLWLTARESDAMIGGKGCNENSLKDRFKHFFLN